MWAAWTLNYTDFNFPFHLACVCVCSFGSAPVFAGRRRGRGMAAGTGAVSVQQGDGTECGRGGEADQTTRSVREISRDLGGTLLSAGATDYGKRERESVCVWVCVRRHRDSELLGCLWQLELLEVRRQQEEEERKRKPPTPEPVQAQDAETQQR